MAKAKRKSKAKPKRPRAAPPRGMYLQVHVYDNQQHSVDQSMRISSFNDITRIGHDVARAVREYLRRVPMLPHVTAYHVSVYPHWHQTAPLKPKQPDGAQRASDLEALEEE